MLYIVRISYSQSYWRAYESYVNVVRTGVLSIVLVSYSFSKFLKVSIFQNLQLPTVQKEGRELTIPRKIKNSVNRRCMPFNSYFFSLFWIFIFQLSVWLGRTRILKGLYRNAWLRKIGNLYLYWRLSQFSGSEGLCF